MLRRFARDDLADRGDGVEAAVRMHVQTVARHMFFWLVVWSMVAFVFPDVGNVIIPID